MMRNNVIRYALPVILCVVMLCTSVLPQLAATKEAHAANEVVWHTFEYVGESYEVVKVLGSDGQTQSIYARHISGNRVGDATLERRLVVAAENWDDIGEATSTPFVISDSYGPSCLYALTPSLEDRTDDEGNGYSIAYPSAMPHDWLIDNVLEEGWLDKGLDDYDKRIDMFRIVIWSTVLGEITAKQKARLTEETRWLLERVRDESTDPSVIELAVKVLNGVDITHESTGTMSNLFGEAVNILQEADLLHFLKTGKHLKTFLHWGESLSKISVGLSTVGWTLNLGSELAEAMLWNTLATAEAQARLDTLVELATGPEWDPALKAALPDVQTALTEYSASVASALWEGLKDAVLSWTTVEFLVSVGSYMYASAATAAIAAALHITAAAAGAIVVVPALIVYGVFKMIYSYVKECHDQVRGFILSATLNRYLGAYMPDSLSTSLEDVEYIVRINNMGYYLENYYYYQYRDYNGRLWVWSDTPALNLQLDDVIQSSLNNYWLTAAPYWLATNEWPDLGKKLATPTVIIDTPSDQSSVSGTVSISAYATDDEGSISEMSLRIDGTNITSGVDINTSVHPATLSYEWDTSTLDPGSAHDIVVCATDSISPPHHDSCDTITVTIQPEEGEPPPIAKAGLSITTTSPVLLDGYSVSEITATVVEEDGDPIGGVQVTFWSYPPEYAGFAESDGTLLPFANYFVSTTSHATGEATAYYRPTRWGRTYIEAVTKTGLSAHTHFDAEYEPAAPANFHIDVSPSTRDVGRSESTTYEVTIVPENGFYRPVTITTEDVPSDVSISGTAVLPDEPTTINVSVGSSAPYGTHTFQFVGTCDEFSRSEDAILIINQGTIEVLFPNGGEVLYIDETSSLEWNYTGGGIVDIDFSTDGGRTWGGGWFGWPNTGSESWYVGGDIVSPTDHALVRIQASSDESVVDLSDSFFKVCDHTLYMKLTSPIGGDVLPPGSFHDIEWITVSDADVTGVDILYSSDGGTTWTTIVADYPDSEVYRWHLPTEMSDQCRIKLIAIDSSLKTGEVESGDFMIGLDTGAWEHTYFGYVPEFIQVDPTNSSIAYMGNDGDGMFKTIDAGVNITPLTGPMDIYDVEIDPRNPSTVYVCDNYSGLYRTTNGGDTWQVIASGMVTGTPEGDFNLDKAISVAVHPDNSDIIFLCADDGMFKSTNGGSSWNWIGEGTAEEGSLLIDPDNPNILYHANDWVYKSTDGGGSWTAVSPQMGHGMYALAMDPQNSSVLYAGGRNSSATFDGALWKTTDGGNTWNPLTYESGWPHIYRVLVDPTDSNTIYAGGGSDVGVLRSTDGGITWSRIGPDGCSIEALGMGTTPAKLLYVGGQASTTGVWVRNLDPQPAAIVISPNGGEEWLAGSEHDILWTTTDPDGAGPVDLYYSSTGDAPWEAIATGLADTGNYTWKIPITPGTNYKVRVVVHNVEGETVEAVSEETFTVVPETMPPAIPEMAIGTEAIEVQSTHHMAMTLNGAPEPPPYILSGEIGTVFTISAAAADSLSGIDPSSVEAHIQNPDNADAAVIPLYDDGTHGDAVAGDEIFTGQWDSSGASEAFYFVDISASDLSGNERVLDNAVLIEVFDYPSITGISYDPPSPTDQGNVTVTATITDTSGISVASIEYSTDGGATWPSVSMNNTSGDEWTGTIPQLAAGTVQFRIAATDSLGHSVTTSPESYDVLDVTPPRVDVVTPNGNSTSISSDIEIAFDEAMDTSSVESAISISPAVTYSTFWMGDRILITPDDNLANSTEYQVTVLGTAQDSAGNGLDGDYDGIAESSPDDDYSWSFTTASPDVEVELSLKAGWNMVSVPVAPEDNSVSAVFPGVAAVFTWDPVSRSYIVPSTIEPDTGYWVAVIEDGNITVSGVPIETWTTDIKAGWNMIGSLITSTSIADPNDDPDGSVQPFAYWWDPVTRTYILTTIIEPTKGYWVASVQDCTLTVP